MQYIAQKIRQKLTVILMAAFYLAALIFVIHFFATIDYGQLRGLSISWGDFWAASFFELVFRFWAVMIWVVLLSTLGAKNLRTHLPALVDVYATAWLGRYTPGKAAWILAKIVFASKLGISRSKLAVGSLLEGGLQVLVLLAVSSIMLLVDPRTNILSPETRLMIGGFTIICLVVMIPAVFNWCIQLAHRLFKKGSIAVEHLATRQSLLRGAGLYTIGALISGAAFFYITRSVYPELSYADMPYVMAVGNLAGAVGIIVLFAPSGLGVREGVQVALLSAVMPIELAAVAAIVARIWSIGIDLLFLLLGKLARRYGSVIVKV